MNTMSGLQEPALRRLAWALLVGAVMLAMCLSAPALALLGIPYDLPLGPFPAKIHPATYLLFASYLLGLASHGNPLAVAVAQFRCHPLLALSLACMVFVFAWTAARHGPAGLAFIIDTLWTPAIGALALLLHAPQRQRRLLPLMMGLLALNAVIAIGEFALQQRLVPLSASRGEVVAEAFFRSSALLGHPLLNALVTVALLPALSLLPWPARWRWPLYALLALALLSFGGRATFVGAAFYLLLAGGGLLHRVARGDCGYLQLTGGLLGAMLACSLLAGIVAASGLGERIFSNFGWDHSAATRWHAWELLDYVRGSELWIGIPVSRIDHLAQRIGIDPRYEAIENFWLYLLLLFGAIGFVPFVIGIGALAAHLWRSAGAAMRAAVIVYFFVASGANTLASKSVSLWLLSVALHPCRHGPRRALP